MKAPKENPVKSPVYVDDDSDSCLSSDSPCEGECFEFLEESECQEEDLAAKAEFYAAEALFSKSSSKSLPSLRSFEHDAVDAGEVCVFEPCAEEVGERERLAPAEDIQIKESIFTHSHPLQFPDIKQAKKSAFGSMFVRARVPRPRSFRKVWQQESQFNMIPISEDTLQEREESRAQRKKKGSVFRAFEKRGLVKDASTTGSMQWDVYPISKSTLFSYQNNDRIHHTRYLSRIEERINTAPVQSLKFAHSWPSGSTWTGHWDGLGMAGSGTYLMPHEVCYIGKMVDGRCHDNDATLIYPNGFRAVHCNYVNGELLDYQFQFPDGLEHEKENWSYCTYPDRRFWSEIQNGLKPAKISQKTQVDPPRSIPLNCYDTNDGFYNPKTKMLLGTDGELLRVPTKEEEHWIKSWCRKGFHEYTRFRPKLFEDWFKNDTELIDDLEEMQRKYYDGEITYDEMFQYYADLDLLPAFSPYKETRTASEMELMHMNESCPSPTKLLYRLEKRYEGHIISESRERFAAAPRKPNKTRLRRKPCPQLRKAQSATNPSKEKISWRIRFEDGIKTPTMSPSLDEVKELKPMRSRLQSVMEGASLGSLAGESDTDEYERRRVEENMRRIIMDVVEEILVKERERHRDRFIRSQDVGNLPFGPRDSTEQCVHVLQELYDSIPDKDEFCDSLPDFACDFKKLAQDRFQMVKYWGKRIFTLKYSEKH